MLQKANNNEISIYLHYPFCEKKCPYCNFYSIAQSSQNNNFGKALLQELKNNIPKIKNKKIISVFFGGGTPALMPPQDIEDILSTIKPMLTQNSEITLEANPSSINKNIMLAFKNAGVNRLSIGVQSFNNQNLNFLGRIHNSQEAIQAIENANNIFDSVSFDIMFGLPNQTLQNLKQDLQIAKNLLKNHFSIYELTIEENTPFHKKNIKPAKEDITEQMYRTIQKFMERQNFNQYEVSNYAKKGYESIHNQNYWLGGEYLGLGPSAHGRLLINNQWLETIQTKNIAQFMENSLSNKSNFTTYNKISKQERETEIMLTMLRTNNPISTINLNMAKLTQLEKDNLIKLEKEKFMVTQKGMGFNDYLATYLID